MPVQGIPEGYRCVTPYLIIKGAADAIAFYQAAFGATERYRLPQPDGRVGHAELEVGGAPLMLADEFPEMNVRSPASLGGSPVSLLIYVTDVDRVFQRAIDAGATVTRPLANQFYGDRSGTVTDPFGHIWTLATRVEDVSPEEMKARFERFMSQHSK
ncbi:MAG: VOC family protein [Gemmataceae bacterium]